MNYPNESDNDRHLSTRAFSSDGGRDCVGGAVLRAGFGVRREGAEQSHQRGLHRRGQSGLSELAAVFEAAAIARSSPSAM